MPGILTTESKGTLLLIGLGVGLSAGVFEELGWTGFAIATMLGRHGALAIRRGRAQHSARAVTRAL